jgi:hypothetical protein
VVDADGNSILHYAASTGDVRLVRSVFKVIAKGGSAHMTELLTVVACVCVHAYTRL